MMPQQEAAAILIRVFEALARASGKTLNSRTRVDIERACTLLASAGAELDDLLDDAPSMPRYAPAEAMIEAAKADPQFQAWKQRKERGER